VDEVRRHGVPWASVVGAAGTPDGAEMDGHG
jgi:hypothetical protein